LNDGPAAASFAPYAADCISDEDLECSAVRSGCDGSASKFLTECGDEI
jgi:hypothetical protein